MSRLVGGQRSRPFGSKNLDLNSPCPMTLRLAKELRSATIWRGQRHALPNENRRIDGHDLAPCFRDARIRAVLRVRQTLPSPAPTEHGDVISSRQGHTGELVT